MLIKFGVIKLPLCELYIYFLIRLMEALLDKLSNTAAVSASATGWAAFYPPPDLQPAKKKH